MGGIFDMIASDLKQISHAMRRDILEMGFSCGANGAHFGGSLSLVEIMAVLYNRIMHFTAANPVEASRDRLILSKGHGVMAQYAALRQIGVLDTEELHTFKQNDSKLSAHPSINLEIGIEFSSGSLGQGLSLGVGSALALKMKGNTSSRVYVILGDGECGEGSIWEAALSASHYGLTNLVAIIDRNRLQYDGDTEIILPLENFSEKWKAFGWDVANCNGHDEEQLVAALSKPYQKPFVLIADTVKGKGISFMENVPQWHNGVLTKSMYEAALSELEG